MKHADTGEHEQSKLVFIFVVVPYYSLAGSCGLWRSADGVGAFGMTNNSPANPNNHKDRKAHV